MRASTRHKDASPGGLSTLIFFKPRRVHWPSQRTPSRKMVFYSRTCMRLLQRRPQREFPCTAQAAPRTQGPKMHLLDAFSVQVLCCCLVRFVDRVPLGPQSQSVGQRLGLNQTVVVLQKNHGIFAQLTSRSTRAWHSNAPQRTMERAAHHGDGKNWWYAGT